MARDECALECVNVSKQFGGLNAVKNVSLSIPAGERRAMIGPNGAGKTTLFNLISGQLRVTSGQIRIFRKDVTHTPGHKRAYYGLRRTFQITNLFPTLPVIDNFVISMMGIRKMKYSMLWPLRTHRDLYQSAEEMLTRIGLNEKAKMAVRTLSHGQRRQVDIALTLITNPQVLLLDEPTEGISPAETIMITNMIRNLDPSITILIIEHDMDVAFQVADRITVLHEGEIFAEGNAEEIRNNSKVKEIYFGGDNLASS